MELDFRKKSRRDRMMRSKSFETQVREINRKEAGESRGFLILWIRIIDDVFQMEGKKCNSQKRLKMWKKFMPDEEGALAWNRQIYLASGNGRGEVCGSSKKFSSEKGGAERQMRLLKTRGLA